MQPIQSPPPPFTLKPPKPFPACGALRPVALPLPPPLRQAGAVTLQLPVPPQARPPLQAASPLAALPPLPLQPASRLAALPPAPLPRFACQDAPVSDQSLNSWVTCVAKDGTPYFYHPASGKTSWDWRDGGEANGALPTAQVVAGALPAVARAASEAPLVRKIRDAQGALPAEGALPALPDDIEWDVVLVLPLPEEEVRRRPTRHRRHPQLTSLTTPLTYVPPSCTRARTLAHIYVCACARVRVRARVCARAVCVHACE